MKTELMKEMVTTAPEKIQARFRRGKAYYDEGLYQEAAHEFEAIVKAAPGNIDARIWLRKAKDAHEIPHTGTGTDVEGKQCIWQKVGVISYRICTNNHDCLTCEFDQQMQEKIANGRHAEAQEVLRKIDKLPGNERVCRYALKGEISYRLCTHGFQCGSCEFAQMVDDQLEAKLQKLMKSRKAARKAVTV